MSFVTHRIWEEVRPYLRADRAAKDSANSRYRIEVQPMPRALQRRALAARSACPACGTLMHPIRARRGPPARGDNHRTDHLYFAATCPQSENISCSRGAAARDEYDAVARALR